MTPAGTKRDDVTWRRVFYVNVFFSCVSFSIVLPSIWPYLQLLESNEQFLAFSVAIYSIGEAVGSLWFGALSNRMSIKAVMIYCTVLGLLGSLLYSTAVAGGPTFGPWMIFVGRLLQGLWTGGAQASQMNHLARVLKGDLTSMTVKMNGYACLGFVIGPAFGVMFSTGSVSLGPLLFDEITLPGYLCSALAFCIILLFIFCFDDTSGMQEVEDDFDSNGAANHDAAQGLLGKGIRPPNTAGVVLCNVAFAVHFFGFALQETITTPIVEQFYHWNVFQANSLFTVSGFLSLITFVLLNIVENEWDDRLFVLLSILMGVVGYGVMVDLPPGNLPLWRFLLGFFIVSVAFPISRAMVAAVYSRVIGPNEQGTYMGVLFAAGAMSRVLGPFLSVKALLIAGPKLVFGATSALFIVCAAVFVPMYSAMAPYEDDAGASDLI